MLTHGFTFSAVCPYCSVWGVSSQATALTAAAIGLLGITELEGSHEIMWCKAYTSRAYKVMSLDNGHHLKQSVIYQSKSIIERTGLKTINQCAGLPLPKACHSLDWERLDFFRLPLQSFLLCQAVPLPTEVGFFRLPAWQNKFLKLHWIADIGSMWLIASAHSLSSVCWHVFI